VENNEARRNRLYINNGNLTFTERAKEYGLDDQSASTGANFFDADNDGDLDCYVLNYPTAKPTSRCSNPKPPTTAIISTGTTAANSPM
jgi:hypothetical protein